MKSLSLPIDKPRVVIVGGGLAGLSAAEALAASHGDRLQIRVLEAKRITGGRAGSFQDPVSQHKVDYCQHVAMGCCTNLIGLLQRTGLGESFVRQQQLCFLHPAHPPSRFAATPYLPPPLHLAAALGGLRYLTAAQKRQVRRGLWRLMRTTSDRLADQPAAQWLMQNGQSAGTLESFWDVVLVSALGEQTTRVSMAAARKVFIDGFAAARGASDVLIPNRPLSELFGQVLPAAVRSRGVQIDCDCGVRHVQQGHLETFRGETIAADHVIVAVPWHRIDSLFPDVRLREQLPRLAQYRAIPSSPITGLHLWFDRQITELPHAVLVGTTAQWLFRQPFTSGDAESLCYYQVVISASHETRTMPKEQLLKTVLRELRDAFPGAGAAQLVRSRMVTDPQAVFSVQPEVEAIRPSARTPLPWLHLAGDWTATGWPATMEGAVISGRLAACSVLRCEKLGAVTIDPGLPRGWLAKWLIRD